MSRTLDKQALTEHFAEEYRLAQSPIMMEVERVVLGCGYGGTSWTTRAEAERVGRLLELRPGRRLLEVGAGSGWPGLFLARTTGCDVTLLDVPLEAIRMAAEKAVSEQLDGMCWVVVADAGALPFSNNSFDAISHSDVLCCLEAKLSVLKACRQVVRAGGRMVFTVISIAPGLSSTDYKRAADSGPPFVESAVDYPTLLRQARWKITDRVDLTVEYARTVRCLLREWEARKDGLSELFGAAEFTELVTGKRATLQAIEERFLQRELFVADAVTADEPENVDTNRKCV
ncbi:MAG: methyltransferase domain-containing protein [Acidiferrobacterales bacterium]